MDDAEALAQLGERRVLGDEAPPGPRGVGAGLDERALQHSKIDVGAVAGPVRVVHHRVSDRHRLIGLPHEERVTFGFREERDRVDLPALFLVELAHSADEPQRRFAPVDDGDALDPAGHMRIAD